MHLKNTLVFTAIVAVASAALSSCTPPPKPPPPRFKPNPPYPPNPVDAYGNPIDPYGNGNDISPPDPVAPAPAPTPRPGEYPTAKSTANPNQVISPYEPFNVIDVEGFTSGQLARDPSNQKIFRVP